MLRILVSYASRYGSTRAIAEEIAATLDAQGMAAHARPIREVDTLLGYHAAVIGSGVYGGTLHGDAIAFIERHRAELNAMPVAFFAVGTRFALRDDPLADRQREAVVTLIRARVSPLDVHCFAGSTTGFPLIMRALVRVTHTPSGDLRDWPAVRAWTRSLVPRLSACASGAPSLIAPATLSFGHSVGC